MYLMRVNPFGLFYLFNLSLWTESEKTDFPTLSYNSYLLYRYVFRGVSFFLAGSREVPPATGILTRSATLSSQP